MSFQLCLEPLTHSTKAASEQWSDHPFSEPGVDYPLIELTLQNGLRVCLKKTDYESDNIMFQLFAMGGYAALSPKDRPAAILCPDVAWESGLQNKTADQVSIEFYQKSIEIETKIQPFDRQIEISTPRESLEASLNFIKLVFTEPQFSEEGLSEVIASHRESIQEKSQLAEINAQQTFLKENTQNWDIYQSLTATDLDAVQLSKAEEIFRQSFSNPSDFVLVMVGDFEIEETIPLLEEYLGTIPIQNVKPLVNPIPPPFLDGITVKTFSGFSRYKKPQTRLTFPIPIEMNEEKIQAVDLICKITKNRMLKIFRKVYDSKKKLAINYEFPFFPQMEKSWITIQFSCPPNEIQEVSKSILAQLQKLQEEGPTQEEIEELREQLKEQKNLTIDENPYLLSLLANYHRSHWRLDSLCQKKPDPLLDKEVLKNDFNHYLKLDQYSMISLYP